MPCMIRPLGLPENGHKKIEGGRTEDEAFWRTWNKLRYDNPDANDDDDPPSSPVADGNSDDNDESKAKTDESNIIYVY